MALILLGLGLVLRPFLVASPLQRLLRQAESALADRRFQEAEELACAVLETAPGSSRALLIAGEGASGRQRYTEALDYYARIKDDGGGDAAWAFQSAGIRCIALRRVADAERYLRRALALDPGAVEAHEKLARLLLTLGRSWDALPHQLAVLQDGYFNGNWLSDMGLIEFPAFFQHAFVQDCLTVDTHDPTPLLASAREALERNRREDAERLLRQIVAAVPGQLDAQAHLGRLLVETPEFPRWQARLPSEATQHPEIWVTYGLWARQQRQLQAAARCFWEALRLYPEHRLACQELGMLLNALGDPARGRMFTDRVAKLNHMQQMMANGIEGPPEVRKIAEALEALDRRWEATAWYYVVFRAYPHLEWAEQGLSRLARYLDFPAVLTDPAANPAAQIDLSDYPLPTWTAPGDRRQISASDRKPCHVRFVDVAAQAGLEFRYYNGADPERRRAYMFEYSGGGVAVLDFDGDGWPDLYLTQGCPWPLQPQQDKYRDRLFRNLGTGRFEDVTQAAELGDNGMSQGATVGDYDNDGFPDLYVGNIGANHFYHNNGDGTFSDVTEQTGTATNVWTSSCLLADLNGDGCPDLYCVTYLAGPLVFEKECITNGRPVQCAPQSFEAEQDHVYLNLGDGRFREVTAECGALLPDGKGLGIVAGDFDGSRRLSVFVSNDTTPNFFLVNHTDKDTHTLKFVDNAMFSGLACDAAGRSRSGMGIAIADANDDGLLDLVITNFHREYIGFYVQQPDHSFADSARETGLARPTYDRLMWGTQFLDGELDGQLDLVVASGHLNDFRYLGLPYRMRPQYFQNLGDGRFVEAPADTLGEYYQHEHLGRAVARLDWNRDGLEDHCTTHVEDPVALLTNVTAEHGHYLAMRLVGTPSSRDAIGTTLRLRAGKRTWTRQLTAGDGFYASNERKLILGLGAETVVEELMVLWPSGLDQTFRNLEADREVVLVEGNAVPMRMPPP
jgi:tetratricopeptide (TPR) repeat protein